MRVEREVTIDAPPEKVYEVLLDAQQLEDWVTIHRKLEDAPETDLRKGSTLTQTLKLAGREFKVRWKVVQNERSKKVVWDGKGPVRSKAKVIYELAPDGDDATRFSYANEYDLPGGPLGKLAGPAVRRVTAKELDASLAKLKKLVEST